MAVQQQLFRQRAKFELWEKTIKLHSPERIYRMGYTLTTVDRKIIKSISQVQPGQQIQTHLVDGVITSEIK
jgi:exodeoxyribonuclease VII large subunit